MLKPKMQLCTNNWIIWALKWLLFMTLPVDLPLPVVCTFYKFFCQITIWRSWIQWFHNFFYFPQLEIWVWINLSLRKKLSQLINWCKLSNIYEMKRPYWLEKLKSPELNLFVWKLNLSLFNINSGNFFKYINYT